MAASDYSPDQLAGLVPENEHLVGIDSDGCVFDSMTVKQRGCFHGLFIEHWGLQAIQAVVRETLEFVNLYSRHRGQDRFVNFAIGVSLLRDRPETAGHALPEIDDLEHWLSGPGPFSNAGLTEAATKAGSESLARIFAWSLAVDRCVKALPPILPFPDAVAFLEQVGRQSDAVVISSTPIAALNHEWESNGLRPYVRFIAAKELGTKVQHLHLAVEGKYAAGKVLMIGDAPKDLESAREAGTRFFPINPGGENESWKLLSEVVYPEFLAGAYSEERESTLIETFMATMPEQPPWS